MRKLAPLCSKPREPDHVSPIRTEWPGNIPPYTTVAISFIEFSVNPLNIPGAGLSSRDDLPSSFSPVTEAIIASGRYNKVSFLPFRGSYGSGFGALIGLPATVMVVLLVIVPNVIKIAPPPSGFELVTRAVEFSFQPLTMFISPDDIEIAVEVVTT